MTTDDTTLDIDMEAADVAGTSLRVSRVALGTWAIGGWMWGGTDEAESVATIREALERGVSIIDTAPVYGFGRSEEIVGKALAEGKLRSRVAISTKVGLEWRDGHVFRNSSRERILQEIDDSLRRLRTDIIDIYQVHWPDPAVPLEETAETMHMLLRQGKIRAIGCSNFSVAQMEQFRRAAPLHVVQPPYNMFERGIEADIMPYCLEHKITTLGYGALCRGLLSGRMRADTTFGRGRSAQRRSEIPGAEVSANILLRSSSLKGWRCAATASASSTSRSAGCWIRASTWRCGVHAVPINCSRSTRSAAGPWTRRDGPRSNGFSAKRSSMRSAPNLWRRRRAASRPDAG